MTDPATHVVVEDPYAQIPEALLYEAAMPSDAVRVYGVLARHGSDPSNCFPGYHRIAGLIGKSPRSIPAWIKALEDAGWITRTNRWRRGDEVVNVEPADDLKGWEPTSNAYVVHARKRATQRGVLAGERRPPLAGEPGGYSLDSAPKESNRNESNEEREEQLPLAADLAASHQPLRLLSRFDEFWDAYPLHKSKGAARQAWKKATKDTNPEAIIAGAVRYRKDMSRQPRYTKHPATWLNGECWTDEPTPAPSSEVIEH